MNSMGGRMSALLIRRDRSPTVLRKLAKGAHDARVARRVLAIANALSGMSREDAARSAGINRRTLRDWVVRYNEHGLDSLTDRPREGRPSTFDPDEKAELMEIVLAGPDPEVVASQRSRARISCASARSGSARACTCRRWVASCASSVCRDRRRERAICKKTRPLRRPLKRAPRLLKRIQCTHKDKRIRLLFQDEARIGQKGRTCHVWWKRGEYASTGLCDKALYVRHLHLRSRRARHRQRVCADHAARQHRGDAGVPRPLRCHDRRR